MMDTYAHLARLNLERNPFPLTPDADCYFNSALNRRYQAEVLHCLLAGKGFVLLTGEVGTGKSTFVRYLIDRLQEQKADVALVFNTFLQGNDLLKAVCRDFGIDAQDDEPLEALNHYLIARHLAGTRVVLILDDAQNLNMESLELVRILSNLETRQEKLIQILLAGQQELENNLRHPEIRQLASRIAQHVILKPLDIKQTSRYVNFRLRQSRAESALTISSAGVRVLQKLTQGNPRRIHHLLDRALYGFEPHKHKVLQPGLIRQAAVEAGLQRASEKRNTKTLWLAFFVLLGIGLVSEMRAGAVSGALPDILPLERVLSALPQPNSAPLQVSAAFEAKNLPGNLHPDKAEPVVETTPKPPAPEPLHTAESSFQLVALEYKALSELHQCLSRLAGVDVQPLSEDVQPVEYRKSLLAAGWLIDKGQGLPVPPDNWFCRYSAEGADWLVWSSPFNGVDISRLGREMTQKLQLRLAMLGVYRAPLDGIAGPATRRALSEFSGRPLEKIKEFTPRELFRLEAGLYTGMQNMEQGSHH